MTCEHLIELETAIISAGFKETHRGAAWSKNCREWVYFDCIIPVEGVRLAFKLPECVKHHAHLGTHDGQESGFVCEIHGDAVMGHHPSARSGAKNFMPVLPPNNSLQARRP